jgi:hypothetical protein
MNMVKRSEQGLGRAEIETACPLDCPVKINEDMQSGTVGLSKGLWQKSTMNGSTANALIPDTLTDIEEERVLTMQKLRSSE